MWDLPGDLGLNVIDELSEMIGGGDYFFALWKILHFGNAFCSSSIW